MMLTIKLSRAIISIGSPVKTRVSAQRRQEAVKFAGPRIKIPQ